MAQTKLVACIIVRLPFLTLVLKPHVCPLELTIIQVGTNKELYEYTTASTANTAWTSTPDQSSEWALDDQVSGRIAAIGWDDQVRLYYQSDGEVVENVLSGNVWSGASGM